VTWEGGKEREGGREGGQGRPEDWNHKVRRGDKVKGLEGKDREKRGGTMGGMSRLYRPTSENGMSENVTVCKPSFTDNCNHKL